MKQGNYSEREVIELMNKHIPKNEFRDVKVYVWKTIGKTIQGELTQRPLTKKDIKAIFDNIKANPPPAPPENKPKELTLEEKKAIADQKRQTNNKYTSEERNGIEILYFSEAGMLNLIRDDHDEFEVGDERISDREDDGRVYANQEVKRLSDQKMFYFNYVGCPDPHDPYSLDNSLTEIKKTH